MKLGTIRGLIVGITVGAATGLGLFTFVYARGGSYLTDNPAACANCHVMKEQYDGWLKSPHRAVAVCNDCHTPASFVGKYYTKALNGYHHSYAFTTGKFHEPIMIKERNRNITEASCRKCHQVIVEAIDAVHSDQEKMGVSCIRCHASVGHAH